MVLLKQGEPESILETGAKASFWELNLKDLKLLAEDRGVAATGPALLDLLEPLIRDICPTLTDEEVTAILQMRGIKQSDPVAAIIDGENLEDALEPDQIEV